MRRIISGNLIPIKLWLDELEDGAITQANNLANLPFAFKHIAIMPDAHVGFGMPIGGVLATDQVIVPNAVGVDIGCGMCAIKTDLHHSDLPVNIIKAILSDIRQLIPLGFSHHKRAQDESLMPQNYDIDKMVVVKRQYMAALKQIGTLGGGNHFIEIQKDESERIWIMIHSGSRNIGLQVAEHYNQTAKMLNKTWNSEVPEKFDLAFLPFETDEAQLYYSEMQYCVDFAFSNRKLMMDRIIEVFRRYFKDITFAPMINIAHNYAAFETHFNKEVIVHRKGATSANLGQIGIIPGSQGTNSYIVEGLGNPESFCSCSHGAGRVLSRKKAIKTLDLEEEIKKMNDLGIIHAIRNKNDLEEAASAYKDISEVMRLQDDLVKIIHELRPLAVIKG